MKKSPLSRMNLNPSFQHNSSPYGNRQWQNPHTPNRIMYDNFKSDNYQGANYQNSRNYQANSGSDFIPFQTSSPMSQRSNNNKWQGSGGHYSGGYNHRRNNSFNSPGSNKSSPSFSFNQYGRQNYGKKNYQKSSQRKVDIKAYLDLNSIFENPWAEFEEHLNSAKPQNESKTFEDTSLEA